MRSHVSNRHHTGNCLFLVFWDHAISPSLVPADSAKGSYTQHHSKIWDWARYTGPLLTFRLPFISAPGEAISGRGKETTHRTSRKLGRPSRRSNEENKPPHHHVERYSKLSYAKTGVVAPTGILGLRAICSRLAPVTITPREGGKKKKKQNTPASYVDLLRTLQKTKDENTSLR